MKININEEYYIDFDGTNYTPFKFKAGGAVIDFGKHKGKVSKDKWETSGKYFINLESALKWVVVDSLNSEFDEIDLTEYVKIYSRKMEDLTAACQGVK